MKPVAAHRPVFRPPSILDRRLLLAFLLPAVLATPVPAASPREELLRLVPEDVGFCLVVQDLRGHAAALLESPFAKQFEKSPLAEVLRSAPELQRLEAMEKELRKGFGIGWPQLRDDVLGDAVVFAYRPGPAGKPEQEQGIILLRARDAKLLGELFDRLNRAQKDAGDLKALEVREHAGRKYVRRAERKGDRFYFVRDGLLAMTAQEPMLRQALERDRDAPAKDEPPVARQLRLLGADKPLAALWINPRAFQGEMQRRAADAKGADAAVLKTFLGYWKALDGIALCLDVHKDVDLSLTVRGRKDELPPAARRLLAEASKPSELWDRFPDNALLAAAGRVDAAALFELLGDWLTAEDRKVLVDELERSLGAALGKDLVKEVLPFLGPDVGLCITAPPASDKAWFPHSVLALRLRSGPKDSPVDKAVLSAVNSYALLAVLQYNKKNPDPMALKMVVQDKVEVKYLVNDKRFPPGLQPAFALKDGYLVLASSPEVLRGFGTASAVKRKDADAANVPLLRMSLKDLRQFVKERREPLSAAVAEKNQMSKEDAAAALDRLLAGLQLFDRLELSCRAAAEQATLTLRIRTAQPLK